jgi:hypothetical protein
MIVEKLLECRMAGEIEVFGENLPLLSITKTPHENKCLVSSVTFLGLPQNILNF